jgi:hypothetical protein
MCVSSSAIARFDVVLAPAGKRDYRQLQRLVNGGAASFDSADIPGLRRRGSFDFL